MATAFSIVGIAGVLIAFGWFSVRETANIARFLRDLGEGSAVDFETSIVRVYRGAERA